MGFNGFNTGYSMLCLCRMSSEERTHSELASSRADGAYGIYVAWQRRGCIGITKGGLVLGISDNFGMVWKFLMFSDLFIPFSLTRRTS